MQWGWVHTPSNFGHVAEAYQHALRYGQQPSYRARINIIGHSGAGKTTLTKRLLGEAFSTDFGSTNGIETHRVELDLNGDSLWSESSSSEQALEKQRVQELAASVQIGNIETRKPSKPDKDRDEQVEDQSKNDTLEDEKHQLSCGAEALHPKEDFDFTESTTAPQKPGEVQKQKSSRDVRSNLQPSVLEALKGIREEEQRLTGVIQLWDFGGQSEFYTTHHLFLDANAVNIIVMDISKGIKDPISDTSPTGSKAGVPTSQEDFLCYWLRNLQMKAEHNQQKLDNIAIVLTHKDQILAKDTQRYIQEFTSSLLCTMKENDLPTIKEDMIFVVDSREGQARDFYNIQKSLIEMIQEQKVKFEDELEVTSWGAPRPVRWLNLEADIYRTQASCRAKHMKLEEVVALGKIYDMTATELESFLQFQHMMGDFVYFAEEGLREIVITDPQWLIDNLKVIITPEVFLKKASSRAIAQGLLRGTIDHTILNDLWPNTDVKFLIELMQKFDLIIPMNFVASQPQHYLVPSLLVHKKVHNIAEASESTALIYKAKHLAKHNELIYIGAFARLVTKCARLWPLIEDDKLSYGHATFHVKKGILLIISMPHGSIVEVSVRAEHVHIVQNPHEFLVQISAAVSKELDSCGVPQGKMFKVLCPSWEPGETWFNLVKAQLSNTAPQEEMHFKFEKISCSCHQTGKWLSTSNKEK